ncbi:MAG: hypothetical protein WD004_05715 [Actinomycetota bacterium]
MGKFLIEIPHAEDAAECTGIVKVFLSSGSHLLTNAEWGCMDGVHNAWIIVEVDTKDEALAIVPPALRSVATVTALNSFTLDYINAEIERLAGDGVG